jgi:hypothetical protein
MGGDGGLSRNGTMPTSVRGVVKDDDDDEDEDGNDEAMGAGTAVKIQRKEKVRGRVRLQKRAAARGAPDCHLREKRSPLCESCACEPRRNVLSRPVQLHQKKSDGSTRMGVCKMPNWFWF